MKNDGMPAVTDHRVVSHEEWVAARTAFLLKEKEFTRLRDALNEQRRMLPWERVTEQYAFDTATGKRTLGELFEGRSQLVVYHAMWNPATANAETSWTTDAACMGCSFWADNFDGIIAHLNQRDVTMIAASRAPVEKIAAYQKRMGWRFGWVSSGDGPFNFDYGVSFAEDEMASKTADYNFALQNPGLSEREGVSVFYKDPAGEIFHTYSAYARGIDMLNVAYHYLDIVPKGRDEGETGPSWVKRHDEYSPPKTDACH
ncbi:MAG TPA: thioredoxin family protein [Gemmatimonadales bacterium]|nr:thioredoxin family protein [Gemmatimonadales bacterium]